MRRRGAFLFPLLVLLAGASLIREAAVGWLVPAEEAWREIQARRLTAVKVVPEITLVEINRDTLDKHGWPWKAEDFSVFLSSALPARPGGKPFEPAVIGLEAPLDYTRGGLGGYDDGDPDAEDEPEPGHADGPPEDSKDPHIRSLQELLRRVPKLVLGGKLGWSREDDRTQPLRPMPVLTHVHGDTRRLPEFATVDLWAAKSLRLGPPGWENLPDSPGARGLYPLLVRYRGQPVPTLPLQLAILWAKATPDDVDVILGDRIAIGEKINIPIDDAGRMQVNFGAQPARLTYDDFILARDQLDRGAPSAHPATWFHKKVLYLARTDDTVRTLDQPIGGKISPGEFTACAVATIQAAAHPDRIGIWFDWSLVGLAALISYWLPRWKTSRMAGIVLLCEAAYLGAALWVFHSLMLALPGVLPLGLSLWLLLLRVFAKRMHRVIAF